MNCQCGSRIPNPFGADATNLFLTMICGSNEKVGLALLLLNRKRALRDLAGA